MVCLYQLIFPNGKSYIGITRKTAEQRFKAHCLNERNGITEYPDYSPSQKAISDKKYGLDNFGPLPWLTSLGEAIRKYGKENVIVKTLVITNDLDYAKDHPLVEDLKRKDFIGLAALNKTDVTSKNPRALVERFNQAEPFMRFLCGAVELQF